MAARCDATAARVEGRMGNDAATSADEQSTPEPWPPWP
jgi:hypothetical protein